MLTIGEAARQSGVPAKTIRFYEAQGLVPPAARTGAGYRLYTGNDVRRLQLMRRLRLLGLPLVEVKMFAARAFASDCAAYARQLLDLVAHQRSTINHRIAELEVLRAELNELERRVSNLHPVPDGLTVLTCCSCPLVDGEPGAQGYCTCVEPAPPVEDPASVPWVSRNRRGEPAAATE
jgi:DNA-binding transcriptional MerR regulator